MTQTAEMPEQAKQQLTATSNELKAKLAFASNSDRIARSSKAGTLPYFVRDNYITDKDGSLFPLFGYETNTLKLKAFKAKAIELHHGKTFRDGITISNKAIKEWFNQPT